MLTAMRNHKQVAQVCNSLTDYCDLNFCSINSVCTYMLYVCYTHLDTPKWNVKFIGMMIRKLKLDDNCLNGDMKCMTGYMQMLLL